MSDINLRILGQQAIPLGLSDNEVKLSVGSGVTEGRLAQALEDYSASHDLVFTDDGQGNITVTRGV